MMIVKFVNIYYNGIWIFLKGIINYVNYYGMLNSFILLYVIYMLVYKGLKGKYNMFVLLFFKKY